MDQHLLTRSSSRVKLALAASAGACIAVSACYWWQPDWLAPVTLVPAWCWLVPGLVLVGFGLRVKSRIWCLAVLILWVAFTVLFVEEVRSVVRPTCPPTAAWQQAREQGRAVRVVSLNCFVNPRAAAEVAGYEPDIVLLQESPSQEHLERLSRQFFGVDGTFLWGGDTAILARGHLQARHVDGATHFVHAGVELLSGFEADVISVRLNPPVFRLDFWSPGFWRDHRDNRVKHRHQIEDMMVNVRSVPVSRSLVVGGDFNAPPNDAALVPMRERLFDTFRQAGRGWGHTGTNRFPLFRVDQIWASADLRAESVVTRRTIHSDHRMVVCDLILRE